MSAARPAATYGRSLPDSLLGRAGVYDLHGHELTHAHVLEHFNTIPAFKTVGKLHKHAQAHLDDPTHPIHADLAEAVAAHFHGLWHVERFDAPIEWFAADYARRHGTQADEDAVAAAPHFQAMPEHVRLAADAALKRAHHSYQTDEWTETEFANLFMTQGISTLFNQAANGGTANTSGAAPGQRAWYNNAQAVIGVGDATTAAAATQFDLQAATNREWVGMDATFPTLPGTGSNQFILRSTFGSALANYGWQEFAVANDNGSNVTIPGSAARAAANGSLLDRVVSNQGTKAVNQTWQPTLTLSIA